MQKQEVVVNAGCDVCGKLKARMFKMETFSGQQGPWMLKELGLTPHDVQGKPRVWICEQCEAAHGLLVKGGQEDLRVFLMGKEGDF